MREALILYVLAWGAAFWWLLECFHDEHDFDADSRTPTLAEFAAFVLLPVVCAIIKMCDVYGAIREARNEP